jgi:hypothetical protein
MSITVNGEPAILLIGGSGVVGSKVAETLRKLHPTLPILIGGRDLDRARSVAERIGTADAVAIDLRRPDLGLAVDKDIRAVAVLVKDSALGALRFAQARGVAFLSVSSALFEIGPEVGAFVSAPSASAVLMNSNWLAGTATLATLHFAREFATLERIRIAALLDEQDVGGPAAFADYERQTGVSSSALVLRDGEWAWVGGEDARGSFTSVDGVSVDSQLFGNLDLLSLAAATTARSISFEYAVGETASRRRGQPFSHEIILELSGRHRDGRVGTFRYEIVHPGGQAPLTALGIAVALERLVGLVGGAPAAPGLYLPDRLIEPAYMIRRMAEYGTRFQGAEERAPGGK